MDQEQELKQRLAELAKIKGAITSGRLDMPSAEALLTVLAELHERNDGFEIDLVQVRLMTINLLVASARAGLPGALTGISAEFVHNMASQAHENAHQLGEHLEQLEQELKQQLMALVDQ